MFTEQLTERQAVGFVTTTTVNSGSTASASTAAINMAELRRARGFLVIGTVTSTGTITFSLQSSATSGGSFANLTNLTTNPTVTGITTANSLNALEVRADQMPTGQTWLKATATETNGQNVVVTLILVGDESQYKPGSQFSTSTFTNNVVAAT